MCYCKFLKTDNTLTVGGGVEDCLGFSFLESCLWTCTWFLVLVLATTCVGLGGASDGTTVVIVAAFVVVGHGTSNSPLSSASSVFVDLSAMVHFVVRTGTNLNIQHYRISVRPMIYIYCIAYYQTG